MNESNRNKKYGEILAAARDLFWKHGFRRVSVKEICERAGVSKMTYYKHFPNKIELAKMVFDNEVKDGIEKFHNLMGEEIPAPEKIEKMILMKAEGTNNISQEFMEDFYLGSEPELKNFVAEKTRESWESLLKDWKIAQRKGVFRDDFKPELLLQISFKMVELLKDKNLLQLYGSTQELILEFSRFFAYGISPRK
jgi:AcrR family transcriptional regulator